MIRGRNRFPSYGFIIIKAVTKEETVAPLKIQEDDVKELEILTGGALRSPLDVFRVAMLMKSTVYGIFTHVDLKLHGICGFLRDYEAKTIAPWLIHDGYCSSHYPIEFHKKALHLLKIETDPWVPGYQIINRAWAGHGSLKWLRSLGFTISDHRDANDIVTFYMKT